MLNQLLSGPIVVRLILKQKPCYVSEIYLYYFILISNLIECLLNPYFVVPLYETVFSVLGAWFIVPRWLNMYIFYVSANI